MSEPHYEPPIQDVRTGWTIRTLVALREVDKLLADERDRRYTEVAVEREKAVQIKERAEERALQLAREIQSYKDEKANELRSQIEGERGEYLKRQEFLTSHEALVDRFDTTIKPLERYVASQTSGPRNITTASVAAILAGIAIAAGLYFGFTNQSTSDHASVVCSATYHPAPCP